MLSTECEAPLPVSTESPGPMSTVVPASVTRPRPRRTVTHLILLVVAVRPDTRAGFENELGAEAGSGSQVGLLPVVLDAHLALAAAHAFADLVLVGAPTSDHR